MYVLEMIYPQRVHLKSSLQLDEDPSVLDCLCTVTHKDPWREGSMAVAKKQRRRKHGCSGAGAPP